MDVLGNNKLVARQLKKYIKNLDDMPEGFADFIEAVGESYNHYENDRVLLERAMDISSSELEDVLVKIRKESKTQKDVLNELKGILGGLNDENTHEEKHSFENDITTLTTILKRQLDKKRKNRIALIQNKTNLTALIENTDEMVLSISTDYKVIIYNSHFLNNDIFKLNKEDLKKNACILELLPENIRSEWKSFFDKSFLGVPFTEELSYIIKGRTFFYEMSFNAIINKGVVTGTTLFSKDVTRKKEQQLIIEKNLLEKEVLLKEIHHRVKNNMQVISSLLSLQSRYITDEESKSLFKHSQYRVKSMSLIHEMLYKSDDLRNIDYGEYLRELSNILLKSIKGSSSDIVINIAVTGLNIGVDTAIPLGLLINEVITNALKYGLKDKGEVYVKITKSKLNSFMLLVGDNGVGMDSGFDFKKSKSLGVKLIHQLAKQMDGEVKRDLSKKGTHYCISFKDIEFVA